MSKKYQYIAGLQESTGEIIYSRAPHDFNKTTDEKGWIDGGFEYCRHSGLKLIIIELNVSPAELYEDWNTGADKYGRVDIKDAFIVNKENFEGKESFESKKKYATWFTFGKNGDQPRRQIMLENADTDHLNAILDTETHISPETRLIIKSILKDRL